MGWLEASLVDLANFRRGHDLSRSKMKEGEFVVAGSNGAIGYHNEYTTKGPGLTIGRSGNIGNPYFYKTDFWAHNTVLYVDDFKDNWPKYVYYFLKTIDFKQFNTGSAVPTLNRNHIHSIKINIPPLQEQKAIAEVLTSLDDKIELLQKQNETLEALAQTLFRQWFIEEADDSWEEVEISKELTITIGKTPPRKESHWFSNTEGIPWLSIKDMGQQGIYINNTTEYLTKEAVDTHNVRVVPAESVLMSFKLTVGRVAMNHQEMVTNEAIAHFYGFEQSRLTNYYVYLFLKQFNFRSLGSTSSIAQAVNSKTVKSIKIPVPHPQLMAEFTKNVEGLFEKIKLNTAQIQTLEQIRDTLLPKLMSGQVRVKLD